MRQLLEERGWTTTAVDLPTVHAADKAVLGMAADADAVRAAVAAVGGDVVVVAHSYGGVPTTQGAVADNVAHIVYISAFVLDKGESLLSGVGGGQPDWWDVSDGIAAAGTSDHRPQDLFYGDLPPAPLPDNSKKREAPARLPRGSREAPARSRR